MHANDREKGQAVVSWDAPVVRQAPLSDQVAERIQDQIFLQNLQPGDKLPTERELGENFGVSRTVVREAIRILNARGLVASKDGSGIVVTAVGASNVASVIQLFMNGRKELDYYDLHEVRASLETAIVRAASERGTREDHKKLLHYCDEMEANLENIPLASSFDFKFHSALAQATQNDFYVLLHDALADVLVETRETTFQFDPERMKRVTHVHRAIADAVISGDADLAVERMQAHLDDVRETWRRQQAAN